MNVWQLCETTLPSPSLVDPCFFRVGMATVSWVFGATGFQVQVASLEFTNESELRGDMPTSDITLSFTRLNGAPVSSTVSTDSQGNTTRVDVCPLAVRAVVTFVDDGHLDAHWTVTRDAVTGKGTGKGLGKNTTG